MCLIRYRTFVSEDAGPNTLVATVLAKDPDGDGITYKITTGNDEGNFVIDSQKGKISLLYFSQLTRSQCSLTSHLQHSCTVIQCSYSVCQILISDVWSPTALAFCHLHVTLTKVTFCQKWFQRDTICVSIYISLCTFWSIEFEKVEGNCEIQTNFLNFGKNVCVRLRWFLAISKKSQWAKWEMETHLPD